jgi:predicted nucleic acid-binding protein
VILYLDSSSLLKLYLEEEESEAVSALVVGADAVYASRVAYAEARSGLARARRMARLDDVSYRAAIGEFEGRWTAVNAVEVSDPLVRVAGDLAERHRLRGFDAIHLASALVVQREGGQPVTFSAWDDRLMQAAADEGLTPVGNA